MGTQLPRSKWGAQQQPPPLFGPYYGQTAGWIKMPFGTQVDFGPGHIVLDGDPASLHVKGHNTPPHFSGFRTQTKRRMSVVAKRLDGSGQHLAQK